MICISGNKVYTFQLSNDPSPSIIRTNIIDNREEISDINITRTHLYIATKSGNFIIYLLIFRLEGLSFLKTYDFSHWKCKNITQICYICGNPPNQNVGKQIVIKDSKELTKPIKVNNTSTIAVGTESGSVMILSYSLDDQFYDVIDEFNINEGKICQMKKITDHSFISLSENGIISIYKVDILNYNTKYCCISNTIYIDEPSISFTIDFKRHECLVLLKNGTIRLYNCDNNALVSWIRIESEVPKNIIYNSKDQIVFTISDKYFL